MAFDARELIERGIESDELDYKAAMNWNLMPREAKAKILRHCLAFANTRGGCIVIGIGEDASGRPVRRTGLTPEQSHSFDPSTVLTFLNHYAEPPLDLTVERPVVDGKTYAILVIRPFREIPHVCSATLSGELMQGVFYIRTKEASSRPAYRSSELHELVRRALRNQRELLSQMLRGLLYENRTATNADAAMIEDEMTHSLRFFKSRRPHADQPDALLFELSLSPVRTTSERYSLSELRGAVESAHRADSDFPPRREIEEAYFTNTSLRALPEKGNRMWQLFTDGLFHYLESREHANGELDLRELGRIAMTALPFLGRLTAELGMIDEMLELKLRIVNVENCRLRFGKIETPYRSHIPEVLITLHRSAADLSGGAESHARKLIREVAERFNLPEHEMKRLEF